MCEMAVLPLLEGQTVQMLLGPDQSTGRNMPEELGLGCTVRAEGSWALRHGAALCHLQPNCARYFCIRLYNELWAAAVLLALLYTRNELNARILLR